MKKLMITCCTLLTILGVSAQKNVIEQHFQNYWDREDVTRISVTGKIFELAAYLDAEDEETEEFKEFVSSIDFFQMLVGDEASFTKGEYTSALQKVAPQYEELMSIEDKDGTFNFRIKESGGVVREVVMLAWADNDLIIMSISGRMDIRQLSKMGAQIQADGFEHFKKLDEQDVEEIEVYPNPARAGGQVNIKVPAQFVGGEASLLDMQGRLVMTYPMTVERQRIDLDKVRPGQYILEFKNQHVKVTRKLGVE